jgi:hypothetical protein
MNGKIVAVGIAAVILGGRRLSGNESSGYGVAWRSERADSKYGGEKELTDIGGGIPIS